MTVPFLSNSIRNHQQFVIKSQSKIMQNIKCFTQHLSMDFNVPEWSIKNVYSWIMSLNFSQLIAESFLDKEVDGDLLLQITEKDLKDDLEMKNGIDRKRFIRELNKLKCQTDYSSIDQQNIVNFIKDTFGNDYLIYAYNFIQQDLCGELLKKSSAENIDDMLKDAGVTSTIHRKKMINILKEHSNNDNQVVNLLNLSSASSLGGSFNSMEKFYGSEVFVSFNKSVSPDLASLIRIKLEQASFTVYTRKDFGCNKNVLDKIKEIKNFICVISTNTLESDEVKEEIAAALESQANIIPVTADTPMPNGESLPERIRSFTEYNAIRWVHDYQEAGIDKIIKFLTGRSSAISRSGTSSSFADSGTSTPTSTRTPTLFRKLRNRTISNDSAISSSSIY